MLDILNCQKKIVVERIGAVAWETYYCACPIWKRVVKITCCDLIIHYFGGCCLLDYCMFTMLFTFRYNGLNDQYFRLFGSKPLGSSFPTLKLVIFKFSRQGHLRHKIHKIKTKFTQFFSPFLFYGSLRFLERWNGLEGSLTETSTAAVQVHAAVTAGPRSWRLIEGSKWISVNMLRPLKKNGMTKRKAIANGKASKCNLCLEKPLTCGTFT